ncbi:MAG: Na+/H+ antiporter NhaC family protein [Bacteroidales bacterium]|jgi:Na+/H+ antiporter NhaC|nr:hypothetical protein [Bacteroidales bacterium]MDD2205669.1 Na+/H+ antiporter NhaC family protein [Bacteroidales bacterium]MDD3152903.1 Na+/H+ antiporter NhaC family protein [Bacteroidales bacterium]MDD3915263.1 Na+/H+ antiporter NhaC family protein [Bacteroidales bacterium]MDD4634929.1 Na+/H+ antiporter NhaC family protein [Bacteroidales bacterium]
MRKIIYIAIFFLLSLNGFSQNFECVLPEIIVTDVALPIKIISDSAYYFDNAKITVNGAAVDLEIIDYQTVTCKHVFKKNESLVISIDNRIIEQQDVRPIPLWMSIIPSLLAIILAFILKEVFTSLFLGLLSGTLIISFYAGDNFFVAIFHGILRIVDTLIPNSLYDMGHISIIVFSLLIGGLVKIISANGGMSGLVAVLSRKAKTARSGQLITWLLGVLIFFDDYANTLVIGNTMRPITDKLKISREKLSYLVDSTAAPVAALAFITTWIGVELSYIQNGLDVIGLNMSPYQVFFSSLKYSFYPIMTLIFIFILILSKRDFGPMYKAELKAKNQTAESEKEILDADKSKKMQWVFAVLPIVVMIIGVVIGLYSTGKSVVGWNQDLSLMQNISLIIGAADSYKSLLWASLIAVIVAVLMSVSAKLLSLKQCMENLAEGFKTMLPALMILVLAWSMAQLTQYLYTAEFFSDILERANLHYSLMPALSFIFGFIIAFSTGTSWGTMAILYPLVLPGSWMITTAAGAPEPEALQIFYNVTASVLAGAVFGDHCSPISDTTILSSLASSCNHIEHVRTQMPYAITVGVVSLLFGTLLSGLGVTMWLLYPACILVLWGVIRLLGKETT